MAGIVSNNGHYPVIINGTNNHVHLLTTMLPKQSVSELMKDVKGSSSKWINEKKFCPVKFEWQEGFGAFSYGASQVLKVIEYIKNQKKHHEKISFIEEYKALLKLFDMDFDERFIFKEPE